MMSDEQELWKADYKEYKDQIRSELENLLLELDQDEGTHALRARDLADRLERGGFFDSVKTFLAIRSLIPER